MFHYLHFVRLNHYAGLDMNPTLDMNHYRHDALTNSVLVEKDGILGICYLFQDITLNI